MAYKVGDQVRISQDFLDAGDWQADLESALADQEISSMDVDAIGQVIDGGGPLVVLEIEPAEHGDPERYVIGLDKGGKKIKAYSAFEEEELEPYVPPENPEETVSVVVTESVTYTFKLTQKEYEQARKHGLEDWFCNKQNPVGDADQYEVRERNVKVI